MLLSVIMCRNTNSCKPYKRDKHLLVESKSKFSCAAIQKFVDHRRAVYIQSEHAQSMILKEP